MGTCYYIHEIPPESQQKISKLNQLRSACISKVESAFTGFTGFSGFSENVDNTYMDLDFINDLRRDILFTLEDAFKCELKNIRGDYEIHIGKMTGGYRFVFSDYKKSYNEWISYIKQSDGKIYDEYNNLISAKDLLEIISLSEANRVQAVGKFYYKDDKTMFDVLSNYWC